MGEPEVFGMWSGWQMLEDIIMCPVCEKQIPEDQATHCRLYGVVLCPDCEVDGLCSDCTDF